MEHGIQLITKLRKNMRLFMAPGMHHCGGGPGPNLFDTLSVLEKWVEGGVAPDAIPATHFANNNRRSASTARCRCVRSRRRRNLVAPAT